MAYMDAPDMLARVIALTRVPTSATFPASADWYNWFTEADNEVKMELTAMFPNVMTGAPVQMVSTDSGKTYYFALDAASNPIYPLGSVRIYASLADIPSAPLRPMWDYAMEGYQIRFPNNVARTFSAGPYAQFVTPTVVIDATHPSTLPTEFRMLDVYRAAAKFAASGGQQDPTPYMALYEDFRARSVLPALATQFRNQGAAGSLRIGARTAPYPINT